VESATFSATKLSVNNVSIINSPIHYQFRARLTLEPIHCQCGDHVLLSSTNHQPPGLVSPGRQRSPFLVTEQWNFANSTSNLSVKDEKVNNGNNKQEKENLCVMKPNLKEEL
jgi:hypothetical protein